MRIKAKITVFITLFILNGVTIFAQQRDLVPANSTKIDASIQNLHTKVRREVESKLGLINLSLRSQITLGAYWKRNVEGNYYLQVKVLSQFTGFMFPLGDGSGKAVTLSSTPAIKAGRFTISNIVWQLVNVETNTRKTINLSLSGNWMQDKWNSKITNTNDGGELLFQSIPLIFQKEVFTKTFQSKLSPSNPAYNYNPKKDYVKWNEWRLEVIDPGVMTTSSFPINDIQNYINGEKKNLKSLQTVTKSNNSTNTIKSSPKKSTSTTKKESNTTKAKTIGNTGKTYEQLEYERKAYERQQQEKIKKAVDPGGYIMQKSGLNDFYRNEIAKANRASDLKKAKEEREWEAERRRQRRERIEEDRRAEEYRKRQEEQKTKYNLSLEEAYQKKGGDANFNAKLKEFHSLAISKMTYINSYLTKNGSPFQTLNYMDNCSYVQVIETIQKNDQITYGAKIALIEELLSLKKSYVDFYMNNSKHGHDYGKSGDYHDNTINSACGQYILTLGFSLNAPYNYHSKGSRSISNTKTDFDSEYKKRISPFQSEYDYAYYFEFRTYLKFYLEKSWTTYGPTTNKKRPTILNRSEEIEKIKLTYTLGINYHNRKDIDELTMAVFNYNHGFFDDALNHFKIYQLRTSDKEKMVGYWNLEDETVISSLLGAILYMDNENYSEALKYLKKLKTHNLPILKKKGGGDDKTLEKAILKLENLIFFELEQYTDMWLPKDKKYFKGGTSRGNNYDLLKYYNPGILAEALYKTGNEDFAEELIDFIVGYIKRVYKFDHTYRGTQSEIDAVKRMMRIFNPKALEKISFEVENKYSLAKNVTYDNNSLLLNWVFYRDFGNPINNTPIDLKNEGSWIKLKERQQETISKEALNTIFNEQLSIYKKGKLDISDESKAFLASLVQLGVWTGNFYEAMPAMWDLKNNYDAKDYVLFEKLLTLMTSNIADLSIHHFLLDKNGNRKRDKNYENLSIEWFFANKNEPIIKEQLNEILKIWTFNDYTHFLIPFLYELQI